jgi:alkylmercury lyase
MAETENRNTRKREWIRRMDATRIAGQLESHAAQPEQAEFTRSVGALVRRLAQGLPIAPSEAATLLGWREADLETRLALLPLRVERDDKGCIVGAGLTLRPTRHRFVIDGKRLYTWCALDALIFPILLGRTAQVTSPCASTGRIVSVTVSPEGILAADPPEAVVSVVPPERNSTDIRQSFCVHVNFFASAEAARTWSSEREDAAVMSLQEAFSLAHNMAQSFGRPESCGPQTC